MKTNWLFYLGVSIDALVLLFSSSNLFMMNNSIEGMEGQGIDVQDGITAVGKTVLWLIPIALVGIICTGFYLRSNGKLLASNILVWIIALPMLAVILLWGGLAVLFILFGQ
ncbi:MAG: hypothetical protein ABIQ93_17340 [Saprospiraceae bacterium]